MFLLQSMASSGTPADQSGHLTTISVKHINQATYSWTIRDFLGKLNEAERNKRKSYVLSDPFDFPVRNSSGGERMLRLQFALRWTCDFAMEKQLWKRDYMTVGLQCLNLEANVTLSFKIQLKTTETELQALHQKHTCTYQHSRPLQCVIHLHRERMRNLASNYAEEDGKLTFVIGLDLVFEDNHENSAKEAHLDHIFWENRDSTGDITVACGSKHIPAHKAVLAARSDVFAAMFQHKETLESQTDLVTINDVDEDCFEEFIRYMYLNQLNSPDLSADVLEDLLVAADKYLISSLKAKCEYRLGKLVNGTNFGYLGALATQFNAISLRKFVVQYVKANCKKSTKKTKGQWKFLPKDIKCETQAGSTMELSRKKEPKHAEQEQEQERLPTSLPTTNNSILLKLSKEMIFDILCLLITF